jgi:hypothetical protein
MDILNSIEVLTLEDAHLISVHDISSYHESFTLDNPMTYVIFLSKRLDLSAEEIEIYRSIIRLLQNNERIRYERALRIN